MDDSDYFAYFSNYGNPPIDFCMLGVNTFSTYKDGGYETYSGTSMTAPHMCGVLLMTGGNLPQMIMLMVTLMEILTQLDIYRR